MKKKFFVMGISAGIVAGAILYSLMLLGILVI